MKDSRKEMKEYVNTLDPTMGKRTTINAYNRKISRSYENQNKRNTITIWKGR